MATQYTISCQSIDNTKKKQSKPVVLNWDGHTITNVPPPALTHKEWERLRYAMRIFIRLSKMKEGETSTITPMKLIPLILILSSLFLSACSLPCTYNGKAVPKQDAERMKQAGMDVVCPE